MRKHSRSMLQGPLLPSIIAYTIPIILTSVLQLLFNAADLIVVGRFCGSDSVAAVGATGAITNLIVNLFVGLSVGAGVTVAHALGAREDRTVHRAIHTLMPTALVSGVVLTVVCLFLVGRGVSSLSFLTERLVPLMTGGYLLLSAAVLILRAEAIPQALAGIFHDAFTPQSAAGGALGFLLNRGVRYGTMRGLLSNEAGCGTAPIAHAASDTKSPAEQGFWGLFEVFVDTILLCTVTALVILVEPQVIESFAGDGVMMTIAAYAAVLGQGAAWFLAVAVLLFGFATVICWSHYGAECIRYLTRRPAAQTVYHIAVCLSVLCGSLLAPDSLWDVADFAIGAMTLINLYILVRMRREIRRETGLYFG